MPVEYGTPNITWGLPESRSYANVLEWVQLASLRQTFAAINTADAIQNIPVVGSTNSENQGGNMPETTDAEIVQISVPHTGFTRREISNQLGGLSALLGSADPEVWERHRLALSEATQDFNWSVTRGLLRVQNYPTFTVGGVERRSEYVPIDTANQFVETASNGRVRLAPTGTGNGDRLFLQPVSSLEQEAWVMYGGSSSYIYPDPDLEGSSYNLVSIRALSSVMGVYSDFSSGDRRVSYMRQALRARRGRGPVTQEAPVITWTDGRILKFETFMENLKSKLVVESNPFQSLPLLPHKTLSSRTWGIEIEAVDIAGVETPKYWELKGDGSLRSLHTDSQPSRTLPNVELVSADGTEAVVPPVLPNDHDEECHVIELRDNGEDDYDTYDDCTCGYWTARDAYYDFMEATRSNTTGRSTTGEWNSPVLRSFHSRGLKHITDAIEHRRTNDSAGVHVHVGAGDLTPAQAVQVSVIYTALEPLFEAEYHRASSVRSYCRSVDIAETISRFNAARRFKGARSATEMNASNGRYWTVNLAALRSHKTIEFRAMGAVYNYDHLVRWAYLVREIVNIAKANVPQSEWTKVRTIKDLVVLFSKYGKETPTPEWADAEASTDVVAALAETLGVETRRAPHASRMIAGDRRSLRLVNDDYSSTVTQLRGGGTAPVLDRSTVFRVLTPA